MANGWSRPLSGFTDMVREEELARLVDMAEHHARGVIYGAPIDTSRFLSNNNFSVNKPDESFDESKRDVSRSATLANARLAMASLKYGDVFYVVNTTPYGEALEYGHSKQAPNGIFRLAANNAEEYAKR
jgi:hypothetical protein